MKIEGFEDVSPVLRGGVYVLCYRGAVVYVGQSKACLARIYTHKQARGKGVPKWIPVKGITYDEVHVRPIPDPFERAKVEAELIDRYRPKFNTQLKAPAHVPISAPTPIQIGGLVLTLNRQAEASTFRRRI